MTRELLQWLSETAIIGAGNERKIKCSCKVAAARSQLDMHAARDLTEGDEIAWKISWNREMERRDWVARLGVGSLLETLLKTWRAWQGFRLRGCGHGLAYYLGVHDTELRLRPTVNARRSNAFRSQTQQLSITREFT